MKIRERLLYNALVCRYCKVWNDLTLCIVKFALVLDCGTNGRTMDENEREPFQLLPPAPDK